MDSELKVGDVVVANSGGPKMTVNAIVGDQAVCVWFDGGGMHSGQFAIASVNVAAANDKVPLSNKADVSVHKTK